MFNLVDLFSARFSLAITILLMGLLGLFFALLTGEWYKTLVLENEQRSLTRLLEYEAHEDLKKHKNDTKKLAQSLLKTSDFRSAVKTFNKDQLQTLLNNQFHQYFVTAKRIELTSLSILDLDFAEVVRSSENALEGISAATCQNAINRAKKRQGTERLKIFSDLCQDENYALHALIVPLGGLKISGYLMVLSNPVDSLLAIQKELDSPIEIRLANGKIIVHAGEWSSKSSLPNWALSQFTATNLNQSPVLNITLFKDISGLLKNLQNTRLKILLIVFALTGLAILIAFIVLDRTLLAPLKKLTVHLRLIQSDRQHLGEPIEVLGNSEMKNLAENFNNMSAELKGLYNQMEHLAFSDPLTQLPNRAWFYKDLKRLSNFSSRNMQGFSLLFLDLNKFKPINDQYGHQIGDEVLKAISQQIIGVLRGSDYMARMHITQENTEHQHSLARMGGDEFAVLLPGVMGCNDAINVAKKIIAAVTLPIKLNDLTLHLGVSIGIANYPQDSNDVEQLIHYADLAMYEAKSKGTGYACFNPELIDEA